MKPEQIKILIADADAASSAKCAEILSSKGYQVEMAKTPEEAVAKSQQSTFHVIVTEMKFDGQQMGGLDVIRQIHDAHRHTCAVVLTANPSLEGAIQAIQLGVCDYLSKPIDAALLLAMIERLTRRRPGGVAPAARAAAGATG